MNLTKPCRGMGVAVAAFVLAAGAFAQDSPYAQLKEYDFQNRTGVAAIERAIRDAGTDRDKVAAIEKGVLGVLADPSANSAGKQEACKLLWIVGSARSVPALARMLRDEELCDNARYALERNPDPSAARALRVALSTTSGKSMVGVINSLGNRRDGAAVAGLKKLVRAADPQVRDAAVVALGKIGTPASTAALMGVRNGGTLVAEAIVRSAAQMVGAGRKAESEAILVKMAREGTPVLGRTAALQALVTIKSAKAGPTAVACLRDPDDHVVAEAARVCGSLKDAATTRRAIAAFASVSTSGQAVLLHAFADRAEPTVAPLALKATRSSDAGVRAAAIRAAALTGRGPVIARLCEIATGSDSADSAVARGCLATIGWKGAEQLILTEAKSGKPEVRSMLMGVLAVRPTPTVLAFLTSTVQEPAGPAAREAARSLERVGGLAQVAPLVKVVATSKDDDVRDTARSAVVACAQRVPDRDQAVVPVLAALRDASDDGRAALLRVLAEVGGDRSLAELTRSTGDSNAEVKRAAIAALAEAWSDSRPLPTLMGIAKDDANKSLRVQALRGGIRLIGQDEGMAADQKVARLRDALALAERSEEKRQVLSVLRDCRVPGAVDIAASMLDDADLFPEASDAILYLAAKQRKNDRDQVAVTGTNTVAALTRVIEKTTDADQKATAEKLREQMK